MGYVKRQNRIQMIKVHATAKNAPDAIEMIPIANRETLDITDPLPALPHRTTSGGPEGDGGTTLAHAAVSNEGRGKSVLFATEKNGFVKDEFDDSEDDIGNDLYAD